MQLGVDARHFKHLKAKIATTPGSITEFLKKSCKTIGAEFMNKKKQLKDAWQASFAARVW